MRSWEHGALHIGRLVVAPDLQGRGIGQRLLAAAEAGTRLPEATLFTGGPERGEPAPLPPPGL